MSRLLTVVAFLCGATVVASCANQSKSLQKSVVSHQTPHDGIVLNVDSRFWKGDCDRPKLPKCLFYSDTSKMNPIHISLMPLGKWTLEQRVVHLHDWRIGAFATSLNCLKDTVKIEPKGEERGLFVPNNGGNKFDRLRVFQLFDCKIEDGGNFTETIVTDFFILSGTKTVIFVFRHFGLEQPGWKLTDFTMEAGQTQRVLGGMTLKEVVSK